MVVSADLEKIEPEFSRTGNESVAFWQFQGPPAILLFKRIGPFAGGLAGSP
jgi:hypothetical protein